MKIDENIKLKREQIEVNIIELCRYVCTKLVGILAFSLILSAALTTLLYVSKTTGAKSNEDDGKYEITAEEKLANAEEKLALYEDTYERELEYKSKSMYINLNYKEVYVATFQYNIQADEKYLTDAMTAFSSYGNDGGMVVDIYELDKQLEPQYLKEVLKVTSSTYSTYDTSAVMTVRIYTDSDETREKYAKLISDVLSSYSDTLNQAGIINELNKIYEKNFVGQDAAIWNAQKNYNTTITELEKNIILAEEEITNLEDEIADGASWTSGRFVKYIIIGFILGIAVAVVALVLKYLASDKVKYDAELDELVGLPCIGVLQADNKSIGEKITDKFMRRGKYNLVKENRLYFKLKTICSSHSGEKVNIVGDCEACKDGKLNKIKDAVQDISLHVLGDIVNDVDAMEGLETGTNIIIAVRLNKTSYGYIEELFKMCSLKEINILGYIFYN